MNECTLYKDMVFDSLEKLCLKLHELEEEGRPLIEIYRNVFVQIVIKKKKGKGKQ